LPNAQERLGIVANSGKAISRTNWNAPRTQLPKFHLNLAVTFPFPSTLDFAHNGASKLVKKPTSSLPAFRSLTSKKSRLAAGVPWLPDPEKRRCRSLDFDLALLGLRPRDDKNQGMVTNVSPVTPALSNIKL
jgi:hypothetical protein